MAARLTIMYVHVHSASTVECLVGHDTDIKPSQVPILPLLEPTRNVSVM